MTSSILIVDDDPQIREVLAMALGDSGFACQEAANGADALKRVAGAAPDLVILDIGLPEMDGLDACRAIRRLSAVPILFLTARDGEVDRILGLELGADDYVTKPFSPREVVARIRAILRRGAGEVAADGRLVHGQLELDVGAHACSVAGTEVSLTATELRLLQHLMERPDRMTTRPEIADALYGKGSRISERTIDSHLRNLRRKLGQAGCDTALETLHGVGVRLGSGVAAGG